MSVSFLSFFASLVVGHAAAAASWTSRPWAAVRGLTASEIKQRFLGVRDDFPAALRVEAWTPPKGLSDPPSSFDWRTTNVSSCIGPVVDQSPGGEHCGSCWAVSATETFSDRRCIAAAARPKSDDARLEGRLELSALDLIACDKKCHALHRECNNGCLGGYPDLAWKFMESDGLVAATCMPYNLSKQFVCPLPICKPPLDQTKHKVRRSYKVYGGGDGMRKEIASNGPVQATFTVYQDFFNYSSGVYRHVSGRRLGLHAVKVVGYGVAPDGTKFWSALNSWGPTFGLNGTFEIAEGECGFEESVLAGEPLLP